MQLISWIVVVTCILLSCLVLASSFILGRDLIHSFIDENGLSIHFVVLGYVVLLFVEVLIAIALVFIVSPIVEYFE